MQRLLLRLLGRSSSLHQKGCQAINKSIWDSEWDQANTKRKQNSTRAQKWERVLRTLSERQAPAVSKGSLALELSDSMSYSPAHSHHVQRLALGSHICVEEGCNWLRCLLPQDQEAVRATMESRLRTHGYTDTCWPSQSHTENVSHTQVTHRMCMTITFF